MPKFQFQSGVTIARPAVSACVLPPMQMWVSAAHVPCDAIMGSIEGSASACVSWK